MTDPQAGAGAALAAEERRLAEAGAGGDAAAFAELYERYERRAYNLALRVTGSAEDAADAVQDAFVGVMRRLRDGVPDDFAFGSYLFTSTRNAAYDLIRMRGRAEPSDAIPESAAPLGSGAGGLGLDPGDPDEDPDRRQLLGAQREEIRAANQRLPERQREALALRELEELSYDEIAEIMAMNRNSVAQLISRARVNLRAELRGEALASIAATAECERALPLLARREDGETVGDADAEWLDRHLAECPTCPLRREQMQEAGVSYRAWAPIAAAPALFEETMAQAAEALGVDWSAEIAALAADRPDPAELPGVPRPYRVAARPRRLPRMALTAATMVGALLVVLALAGSLGESERTTELPPAKPAEAVGEAAAKSPAKPAAPRTQAPEPAQPAVEEVAPSPPPVPAGGEGGGEAAKDAPRRSSTQRPAPTLAPPRRVTDRPAPEPAPERVTPPAEPPPPAPETTPPPEREPEPPRPPVGGPGGLKDLPGPPPAP